MGVQPTVATVEPENIDVEYYDVTTDFIGLNKEYTTQLTREQLEDLDALFDSIYEHLNQSTSIKESVEIFENAVVKLGNLGLLGDVGIKETEELVTNYNQNPKLMKMLERGYNKKGPNDGTINALCLIAGRVGDPYFYHPIALGLILHFTYGFYLFILFFIEFIISHYSPFCLAQSVSIFDDYGNIISFGLTGLNYWHGGLDGMMKQRLFVYPGTGIIGFTGLKIQSYSHPTYFIGGALLAYIEDSS